MLGCCTLQSPKDRNAPNIEQRDEGSQFGAHFDPENPESRTRQHNEISNSGGETVNNKCGSTSSGSVFTSWSTRGTRVNRASQKNLSGTGVHGQKGRTFKRAASGSGQDDRLTCGRGDIGTRVEIARDLVKDLKADDNLDIHPHDQHGRHGTYGIVCHGAKEKGSNDESKRSKGCRRLFARDDFRHPAFSVRYRGPQVKLSDDRMAVQGYKGWCSAFVTRCFEEGMCFFEVKVLPSKTDELYFTGFPHDMQPQVKPSFRVGFSCRYIRYDFPIGCGEHGYAIGPSVYGMASFCNNIRKDFSDETIVEGDVLGCLMCVRQRTRWLPDPRRDGKLYEFLRGGLLCDPEHPPEALTFLGESWLEFFLNGRSLGRVFENINEGEYHPAVALYMGACLRINCGPNFDFPPPPSRLFTGNDTLRRPYIM